MCFDANKRAWPKERDIGRSKKNGQEDLITDIVRYGGGKKKARRGGSKCRKGRKKLSGGMVSQIDHGRKI